MGIAAVYTEAGGDAGGVQIDMLIDRADNIINVCEIKFYDAPFIITKKYAAELRNKRALVRMAAPAKKTVFIAMVTCFGIQENSYATELVQSQVIAGDLFG
ncbi:ATPase [Agriterribacter sp.]|uniref:ATPase n=1 Tax=Agriterribacter sp. TaxID=2821509 RepID=UPI002D1C54B3|nr:ATPase [Agriterribacter sp.]HRO44468.1 ATPase [Agriterribacter sp.]HRQ16506.1 ATPase [Agriterribacter sp.]